MMNVHIGTSFVAVLGAEQSSLEAVLLKRKIMGPSWLSISKPVRIDVQAQVRRGSLIIIIYFVEQPVDEKLVWDSKPPAGF